jgi:hypothetical protein
MVDTNAWRKTFALFAQQFFHPLDRIKRLRHHWSS